MKARCIIVDDEPLARQVLRKYIEKLPSLDLVNECGDAIEASAYMHTHRVDLIFLDIKMPEVTGMEFLKTFEAPPQVIITTAYSEYALQGYEYAITDYLLKPIPFERFLKAVNKALNKLDIKTEMQPSNIGKPREEIIFLSVDKIERKIRLSDIRCVEACRNFVKIYTGEEVITISKTISSMEANLPRDDFMRVHKSFLVAIEHIEKIQGNKVYLLNMKVPIGQYYRKDVKRMLASHRLQGKK
jgi:DNA-binding LytR/AlgR family response regulator